ncbi:hypothetical protein AVEN_223464-1 [Araneus ventricosus]|uniref:Uncharacterized protein n=1 Tax=Araneus ventricosus TaxID=182803 RepID=A0A4Y2EWV3_ARAVE|nr:hypothetical protein AVEN_223464-1 [Araneus ventricosus]
MLFVFHSAYWTITVKYDPAGGERAPLIKAKTTRGGAIHRSSKMEVLEHEKEAPIVKVASLSSLEQIIRNGGIQKNLKSKTQSADSNLRSRCEGSGKRMDLPTLTLRKK